MKVHITLRYRVANGFNNWSYIGKSTCQSCADKEQDIVQYEGVCQVVL